MSLRELTVKMVLEWIDSVAPFETQEEFDNGGLLVGSGEAGVNSILVALDVTEEVIREAVELRANLIVAHHPLIFTAQKNLDVARYVPDLLSRLIRNDIALIAAHTSMDQSEEFSASAAVAGLLGLGNIRKHGPYLFLGELEQPLEGQELNRRISSALKVPSRLYGRMDRMVSTLAIAGGAFSEGFPEAFHAGAQALLTGEVRHHHAVEACSRGMVLFDGGHYGTEFPMLKPLALGLQKMANAVKYSVQVHVSQGLPYQLQ